MVCGIKKHTDKKFLACSSKRLPHSSYTDTSKASINGVLNVKKHLTRCAKLESHRYHQQINMQLFTGRMLLMSPNQQCQSTGGKSITKLTWESSILVLTIKAPDYPVGRVASPLTPVVHNGTVCKKQSTFI